MAITSTVTGVGHTVGMAFGQSSGPQASGRQLQNLLQLLNNAGHTDFRDARGPMGFTQRQAGGKFSISEAEAFIEQLEQEEFVRGDDAPAPDAPAPRLKQTSAEKALAKLSDDVIAAELQRRGWAVIAP